MCAFVESGHTAIGGTLPVNTTGGGHGDPRNGAVTRPGVPASALQADGLDGRNTVDNRSERGLEIRAGVVSNGARDECRHADLRELLGAANDVVARGIRREVAVHRSDFDLVRIAPDGVAMTTQHVHLVCDVVGATEDVARVGVLRDQAQGLPLTTAADHDARPRRADGWRAAQGLVQLVLPTAVRAVVVAPHLQADLDRLLES